MKNSLLSTIPFLALLGSLACPCQAVPIATFTDSGQGAISGWTAIGQSFTTDGNSYNNIQFNFFSGGLSVAPGTAYLLSSQYAGTPNDLAAAPGLLASAVGVGGLYTFSPAITLASFSTYFVYTDSGADGITYDNGSGLRLALTSGTGYNDFSSLFSAGFLAQGDLAATGAPEVNSASAGIVLCFMAIGLAVLGDGRARKKTPGTLPFR